MQSSSNNSALQKIVYSILKNRLHSPPLGRRRKPSSRSFPGTLAQIVSALIVTDQRRRAQSKRSHKLVTAPRRAVTFAEKPSCEASQWTAELRVGLDDGF